MASQAEVRNMVSKAVAKTLSADIETRKTVNPTVEGAFIHASYNHDKRLDDH